MAEKYLFKYRWTKENNKFYILDPSHCVIHYRGESHLNCIILKHFQKTHGKRGYHVPFNSSVVI